jgi:hypothetical protein
VRIEELEKQIAAQCGKSGDVKNRLYKKVEHIN